MIEKRYDNPSRLNAMVKSISQYNNELDKPPMPPIPEEIWVIDDRCDPPIVKHYTIQRVNEYKRGSSRKAGGIGWMFTVEINKQTKTLFYDEGTMTWFVERRA